MAVLFYDNFHRADSASTGNGWTDDTSGTGTIASGIASNQQFMTLNPAGEPVVYRTDLSESSGIIIRAEFSSADLTDGSYRVGILSPDGSAATPGYAVVFDANAGSVSLVDDSGTLASTSFTFNNTHKYAFEWDITPAPQNWSYLWVWDATTGGEPTPATLTFTNADTDFAPTTDGGTRFYITAAQTGSAQPTETVLTDYVEVQTMHTPPVITNLVPSANYTENAAPVTLSSTTFVTSPDSHFLMTKATIQIDPSTYLPGDELLVFDTTLGTASTSGTYSGINVSFNFDPLTGTLTLSGLDTNVDYAHVLDNIQFHSTSDNPTFFDLDPNRTINWQITDADVPSGPDFAAPVQFDAGASVGGFAVSTFFNDINQDLIPDFVVTNPGSNTVSILYGNGDGTFQAPITVAAGTNPSAIAESGQLDGFDTDIFSDLVVVNASTNQVSVLLGNGSTFEAPITTSLAGVAPTSVAIGDFNEDSKDDIAVAMAGPDPSTVAGTVLVMPGDGTGHFGAPVVLATALDPTFVTTVSLHTDVNPANQHTGLAVTNTGSNSISIFMGDGAGAFLKMPDVSVGTGPVAIVEGRFNTSDPGDDLAVVNSGSNDVTVLFGNNDGTFSSSLTIPVGFHPNAIVTGNFNGDNFLDFVTANGDGTISLVYGHGDGTFDPALTYQAAPIGDSLVAILTHDLDGSDFASDGNPDLAVLDATGHAVSVVLHNPTTQSIVYSTNIDVAPVNDPPVNSHPASISAHQDTPRAIGGLSVTDPDAEFMLVTLSVSHGTIHVRDDVAGGLDPSDISGNDTNSVTLDCDLQLVDATLAALNGVVYTPASGYTGPDILTMVSNDRDPANPSEGQTGPGGPLTDTDNIPMNVGGTLQFHNLDNTPSFTEDGPFVTLDNNAIIQNAITFDGATLALQRDGGANSDDFFTSSFLTPDGDVDMGGGNVVGSYSFAGGVLNITFNGFATETDVDNVLQSLQYGDFNNNPPPNVQIDYSFNDTVATATGDILVAINPTDDPPTIDGVPVSATYPVGNPPVVLSPGTLVSDPDSPNLASAKVKITDGFGADTLTANSGATGITVSYDPGTFTLTLSGAHSLAQYQQVLDTVAYNSSDSDPTGGGSHSTRNITWQVSDGDPELGQSNIQTTILEFRPPNHAPVAQDGSASGNEDTQIAGAAVASDADSDSLTYSLVGANGGAVHGTVSLNTDGSFSYAPAADFNGTDSFNFDATDSFSATSNTATISITVNPVNDAPVAQNGAASGNEDNAINGNASASDVDNDPLTFALVGANGGAAHGAVSLNTNGSFSYTPNHDFNGADSFTFKANDGAADSNTATISLTVNPINDPPVAQNGAASGNEDTTINGTLVATDIDSPSLTYNRVTNAAHGNVTVNADGTFSYTPNHDFNGADSFTFNANDGAADSNTATISLTVNPVNDPPVAQNGSASGNEDATINGTLVATDVDGDPLSFSRVANAAHGVVTVNTNGTFSYTPNADFNGTDSFTFDATDNHSATSNTATISLTVNPVNDPPVIVSDGGGDTASLSVPENTTAVTTVHATDVDSPSLTYSIVGGSDAGKFQINASSGALSFVMAPDFENPTDSDHNNSYIVQVRASDGSLSDDQAITVGVTDVAETTGTLHWMASIDAGAHFGAVGPTEAPIDRWVPAGIADFNGDATSDLAWYNSFSNSIDFWTFSNGQLASSVSPGAHPAGYQPAGFGDFNHDGTGDILWFNATTRDVDLWKISNGQWAGSVDIGTHPAGYAISGVGDFNNDGTSDVLWFNASTRDAEVWKISNGQWAGTLDIGTHPAGYQPALTGDFNGDGTSDIGWYNAATGDLDIWKISNGQWAGSVDAGAHPAGWQPLGAADFNKDGTSDIAWYNPTTNDIDVWLINNGQWAGSVDVGAHPAGWTAIGVGDFDHNGVGDIMWFNGTTGHIENWLLAFS